MSRSRRRYDGRLQRRLERAALAGAEREAARALYWIAGTIVFAAVIWLWLALRHDRGEHNRGEHNRGE